MLFYFKDDTTIIGVAHVRHSLNDALKLYGGHIGYGVAPGLRGNGFATEILKDALQFLKSLNETRALITCDEDNYASVNVILNNGGIEAEPHKRDDGNLTRRFWIDINNN